MLADEIFPHPWEGLAHTTLGQKEYACGALVQFVEFFSISQVMNKGKHTSLERKSANLLLHSK